MIRPSPETLWDRSRYDLIWTLSHKDVAETLRPFMLARSWIGVAHVAVNLGAFAVLAIAWRRSQLPGFDTFSNAGLGFLMGFFLLLPLHEWLHARAYRGVGATDVRVVYQWRSLTAYCVADRFVARRRELAAVCVAPFAVLNPILAVVALQASGAWSVLVAGALVLHTAACSGDFALLNWLWLRGSPSTFSYDDRAEGASYFFQPVGASARVSKVLATAHGKT